MKVVVRLSCMSLTSAAVSVLLILQVWWLWKHQYEERSPFNFVLLKVKWQSKKSEPVRLLVPSWSACLDVSGRVDPGREEWDLIPDFCGAEELLTFFIHVFSLKLEKMILKNKVSQWTHVIHSKGIFPFFFFFWALLPLLHVYFGEMVYPTVFRWIWSIVVLSTIEVIGVLYWIVKCLLKQGLLWKSRF